MVDKPKQPKKPILPTCSRLAAEALVETIDGPVQIIKLVGKVMPVLTRFPGGKLGFRMMTQIRELEAEAELIRLTNGDGQVVRVGVDHVFLRADGQQMRASELVGEDLLDSSWSYPEGYAIPNAPEYSEEVRATAWKTPVVIRRVERGETGPLYGATVKETKSYYLTFGARSRAQE